MTKNAVISSNMGMTAFFHVLLNPLRNQKLHLQSKLPSPIELVGFSWDVLGFSWDVWDFGGTIWDFGGTFGIFVGPFGTFLELTFKNFVV